MLALFQEIARGMGVADGQPEDSAEMKMFLGFVARSLLFRLVPRFLTPTLPNMTPALVMAVTKEFSRYSSYTQR